MVPLLLASSPLPLLPLLGPTPLLLGLPLLLPLLVALLLVPLLLLPPLLPPSSSGGAIVPEPPEVLLHADPIASAATASPCDTNTLRVPRRRLMMLVPPSSMWAPDASRKPPS